MMMVAHQWKLNSCVETVSFFASEAATSQSPRLSCTTSLKIILQQKPPWSKSFVSKITIIVNGFHVHHRYQFTLWIAQIILILMLIHESAIKVIPFLFLSFYSYSHSPTQVKTAWKWITQYFHFSSSKLYSYSSSYLYQASKSYPYPYSSSASYSYSHSPTQVKTACNKLAQPPLSRESWWLTQLLKQAGWKQ